MQQPERMMRTIKEEVIWLHEFTSLAEAKEAIGEVDPKIWTRYKTYITSLKEGSNGKKKAFTKV